MAADIPFDFLNFIGLFLFIAGFVVGLGAVTVIEFHGLLGRKSSYWTEATIRAHKITKPLIWAGVFLAIIGGVIFYRRSNFIGIPLVQAVIAIILIANGYFLSFRVSPFLLEQEKEGKATETLPTELQKKITISFIISDLGWWGALILLVVYLLRR